MRPVPRPASQASEAERKAPERREAVEDALVLEARRIFGARNGTADAPLSRPVWTGPAGPSPWRAVAPTAAGTATTPARTGVARATG